jgi:hypothetical protein
MSETERKEHSKPTSAALWLGRLGKEKKAHKRFRDRAKIAMDAAQTRQGDTDDKGKKGDPIWWSNLKITIGAVFSRQPKPDVRRRVTDSRSDKNIALAVERAITYNQDTTSFADHSNRAVWEFLAAGLGQTRVYMKMEMGERPAINPVDKMPVMDPENPDQPLMEKFIASRELALDYTPWDLFFWEPCKDWDACGWIGFGRWMSKREIEEEFDVEIGRDGAGGWDTKGNNDDSNKKPDKDKYTPLMLVVEFHDKKRRELVTVCEGYPEVLKREPDQLKLKGFFPCPRPMMLNIQSGDLTPCPEYFYIQAKCEEIDRLTERCRGLIKGIRDVGFYDAHFIELAELMENGDGARIPVNNLIQKLRGTKLDNVVVTEDIRSKVETLVQLVGQLDRARVSLFELTGISDIVRGASKASETYGAQEIKERWANVRLFEKMREISYHFRDVFRIMGELISEHFTPEQLSAQSGIEITPEMAEVLKSDLSRCYAIDIEADSTIAQDEQQDKTERNEFLTAVTNAVGTLSPMVQQGFMPADVMNQLLLFTVRTYKHGRMLEETFEKLPDTMKQLQDLQGQVQQGQQAQDQSAAQMQQMQSQAAQQAQEAQKAMEALQREAEGVIAQQQADLDRLAKENAALQQQVSMAKQVQDMATAREKSASADLKDAQASKLMLEALNPQPQEAPDSDVGL